LHLHTEAIKLAVADYLCTISLTVGIIVVLPVWICLYIKIVPTNWNRIDLSTTSYLQSWVAAIV